MSFGSATVDEIRANVTDKILITRPADLAIAPDGFDYEVTTVGQRVGVGEVVEVPFVFRWVLPDDAPHMLAVCRCTFALYQNGELLTESDPLTFVIQSDERVMGAILDSGLVDASVADQLRQLDGKKTDAVQELIRAL